MMWQECKGKVWADLVLSGLLPVYRGLYCLTPGDSRLCPCLCCPGDVAVLQMGPAGCVPVCVVKGIWPPCIWGQQALFLPLHRFFCACIPPASCKGPDWSRAPSNPVCCILEPYFEHIGKDSLPGEVTP